MTLKKYDISETDFGVIQDLLTSSRDDESYFDLVDQMVKIFGRELRPGHYLVMGYLVGVRQGSEIPTSNLSLN